MNLLNFFKTREEPGQTIDHPVLGSMRWSATESEWEGSYNGFSFSIPRYDDKQPSSELLAYAMELLRDRETLFLTLAEAKQRWLTEYPGSAEEVNPLQYDSFALYKHEGICRSLTFLTPEYPRNAWRMEFRGVQCEGLGFDS